ncbi:hypothetical protein IC762_05955 [Bradyrhizobium genosp. L]|uniref:hypothetical protein n=1 Tax=Bradyrhizobium genosp. L TaxID=83637 RepID=UPI0018A2E183|nr:hypothetical protein [Bradyrhizobium genosp. L]QPF85846.1 hypothetical protein IC762_05955 [Bradyrhizobium genosp. L]
MTAGVIADSIVNLCGAIGLAVAMATFYRRDPRSPLTRRLLFALGVIALLFLDRGLAWWSGSGLLDRLSVIPASLIPLGALVVTEGILRRHAPRAVKLAALGGGIVLGLGGMLGLQGFAKPYVVALALFQLLGFATCALLLAARDRTALMASENRSIARMAVGALVVIPFILTDFRTLFPDIPVRLGALGALLTVTVMLIAGGGAETRRHGLALMALRLISSGLLGLAAAFMAADVDTAQIVRFVAVAIAGVLTIGLMTDALRALFESQEPGVLNSIAASPAQTREQLIAELARHPIFESARRFRESELALYDPPLLRDFLSERRVLRRPDAPWGLSAVAPAAERMVSLMTANSATHVIVLAHDPLDLIVLAVPVTAADPATETALALVRRLLALTPEAT